MLQTAKALAGPRIGPDRHPSFAEFVVLIALMTGLTALSIDNLLPAFEPIRIAFEVESDNQAQLLVYVYMLGFGLMQLVYGPIADGTGRRPVLLAGLALYVVGTAMAIFAPSFPLLLAARFVQGLGAAAARVLSIAIVRDRFEGREMARVMSLTMMVFIIVPVFAPSIGSFFLLLGGWQGVFLCMLAVAIVLGFWFGLRMPETLRPEFRRPLSAPRALSGFRTTVTARIPFGYSTAMGLMFGCLMSYVGSAQQIFQTGLYDLGALFPVAFGAVAAVMSIASLLNARLVRRLGTRRLSHTGLVGFMLVSAAMLASAWASGGHPPLLVFCGMVASILFLFSLTVPNFNAMAMEPLGAIAGTASSFIGFYTTLMGALLGLGVGLAYDGTVLPLATGFFVLSALAVLVVLWAERGRLFVPHHPDPK